ncbi:ATP-binding protein [Streptomyces sp. NPDC048172]|uniref:ATP-binding protein n=1 Tax=Streptomyces sp. NPDC048172 TaxID=3365505 RepID=UPI0037113FC8
MSAPRADEPVTVRVFVQRFSATRRGARLARRLAACQLDEWGVPFGSELSEKLALVVAELAANAVLHGHVPGRDFEVVLTQEDDGGGVRIEVSDTHPALPVRGEDGYGLALVDALAESWGVDERDGPGKTVWAVVTCSRLCR